MKTNLQTDESKQVREPSQDGALRLLTKAEVARLIRKSQRTVEHWVNAGYLSCIRISHSVLFDRDQVIADLNQFKTGGRDSGR